MPYICPDCKIELKRPGNHPVKHGKKVVKFRTREDMLPEELEAMRQRRIKYNKTTLADLHRGKPMGPMSEETKQKIGEKLKQRWVDDREKMIEINRQVGESRRGQEFSEEHRQKLAENMQKRWNDPVEHERMSEIRRSREHIISEQGRKNISDSVIKTLSNRKKNKTEEFMEQLLGQDWEFVGYSFKGRIGRFFVDFIYKNQDKKAIELFGCVWHGCKICKTTMIFKRDHYDEERLQSFKDRGWDVLVIWEHELKYPLLVLEKVRLFIESN